MTTKKYWLQRLCITFSALAGAPTMAAAETPHPLGRALLDDSEITVHVRSHYLNRDKRHSPDSRAWAAGGWLGYRSGWAADTLRLGLTAHASGKLYGPADKDSAALLLAGQRSYSVLGEAYAALKFSDHVLTGGRFVVNQFEVNPQDTRMTPRSYQGIALNGQLGGVEYYLARLERMKSRNWDYFEDIASVAGAPADVRSPLYLISLRAKPAANLNLGFASYRVSDVLASTYADLSWLTPLSSETQLRLGAQAFHQSSRGRHRLTGSDFSTWTLGLKADLIHGPLTLSAIAMKTDEGAAYRTPFGSWPGYTSRIINNFNRAGEEAWAIDAAIDFARLGAPGLSVNGSATLGRDAINASTGAALSRNREYDLTADYRFTAAHWPEWARPLALRARLARFEQDLGSLREATKEYHLILNYTVIFK